MKMTSIPGLPSPMGTTGGGGNGRERTNNAGGGGRGKGVWGWGLAAGFPSTPLSCSPTLSCSARAWVTLEKMGFPPLGSGHAHSPPLGHGETEGDNKGPKSAGPRGVGDTGGGRAQRGGSFPTPQRCRECKLCTPPPPLRPGGEHGRVSGGTRAIGLRPKLRFQVVIFRTWNRLGRGRVCGIWVLDKIT